MRYVRALVLVMFFPTVPMLGKTPLAEKFAATMAAIRDLTATFGQRYPKGPHYLARLTDLQRRVASVDEADRAKISTEFATLRRQALVANPLVSSQAILFVVRRQYKRDHHNSATMFQTGEINTNSFQGRGAIKTLDLANGGKINTLLQVPNGVARDPQVSFDGKKIIFAMRTDIKDDYHIYEMNIDGTDLKQFTLGRGITDIDPIYLPDGSIVFSSTREPKYCMCNRHIMANLFRMDADGANIHQIGKSTLHEAHGSVMPDGRILYDRWEYVDRNFGDAQGLWTVNPDGTNHAVYYGNNTLAPGGAIDARTIPGTHQVLCIFASCHDLPWGALTILDRRLGIDGAAPVVRIWPPEAIELIGGFGGTKSIPLKYKGKYAFDNLKSISPKYEDPFPLSDKYFLCSRTTHESKQMGIYLIDIFGNQILLHTEKPGCFDPMPLALRTRPQVIPSRRNFSETQGHFYVTDVYSGTHMKGVRRGTVKYLRVVESPEKRFWTYAQWRGQGVQCPGINWHDFNNKRILGTVPVEQDGSAYFEVPVGKFVYFQLLDEKGMMIQSMRSGTIVQPGETTGCTGCHENRRTASPLANTTTPLAIRRPPSKLTGWYGPPRLFSYMAEVQPAFNKFCVNCHDYGKDTAKKLNLSADRTNTFNTSYNELWRKGYIKPIGAGPAQIQQPYSWGSHASKIVKLLKAGHKDVKLDKESFDRIVTWIDINAPYYPTYAAAYPDNLAGRSPLDGEQIKRLSELTGVPFAKLADHRENLGPQTSFDRPELSPCLAKFQDKSDPDYKKALAIIEAGTQMLRNRPRADMAGFQPCPVDQRRQEKYLTRQQIQSRNCNAICAGVKAYDYRYQ